MSQSKTNASETSAHDVLQKITLKHLKDAYGDIDMYKKGRMEFWKFNENIVKPYFYADHISTAFIMTPSKANVETIIQENAYIMGSDYYGGNKDKIIIYFFQPEIVLNHYVLAEPV